MGLEDYLLTAVLRGMLAQRLVRRLCDDCKQRSPAPPELALASAGPTRPARPIMLSCRSAARTAARPAIAAAGDRRVSDSRTPEIERLIFSRADHATIERAAIAGGMKTMFDAGLAAALARRNDP